jgi:hypothetical protein
MLELIDIVMTRYLKVSTKNRWRLIARGPRREVTESAKVLVVKEQEQILRFTWDLLHDAAVGCLIEGLFTLP